MSRTLALAICLVLCFSFDSAAQEEPAPSAVRVMTAVRVLDGESVRVDGVLDEAAWQRATAAAEFLQRDPDSGAPATERTEIRILYDAERLLIGAWLFDSEPDRLLGNQMQRDQGFGADDRFIVTLDPFLDGRTGYVFQTNPVGALSDGLISPSGDPSDGTTQDFGAGINRSWDGIWTVRVRRSADGWTAEMEIPFGTLNFDPNAAAWGINFQRTIRRKAEETLWSGHLRNQGVAHMSSAGRLLGLNNISQGLGLDVKPYVVGNLSSAPGRGREDHVATGDVGVDLFYNLTPALRANLSINTDFAETEVDERQVNLTRFPLFFEEKREFFLQGDSFFDFGREIGNQVTPFFSRRIGLDAQGVPQRIDVGGKITGQVGAFDLGLLQVRTAETATQAGSDFSVARVRRRLFEESFVGGLFTRRADREASSFSPAITASPDLYTAGLDYALRTSRFMGDKTVEWTGWFVYTTNPLETGQNIGRGSRLAFPNDPFYFDFSYRELQPNYDPAVGFRQRVGFRRYNPEIGYTWRFRDHPWIRSIQQEIDWEFVNDMDNRLLTRIPVLRPFTMTLNDGSEVAYEAEPTYERLDEPFEIFDGIELPIGSEYEFTRHSVGAEMADRYPVAVGAQVVWGDFFSGRRRELSLDVGIRPRAGVRVIFEAERNVLDLAEGSFETNVYRADLSTQFSPWLSLVNNLQYDSVSRLLGWQLRMRWIRRPGNDLFLVYTHNWQEFEDPSARRFGWLDNRLATKVVYTLRF